MQRMRRVAFVFPLLLSAVADRRSGAQALNVHASTPSAAGQPVAVAAAPDSTQSWIDPTRGLRRALISYGTPVRALVAAGFDQVSDRPDSWSRTLPRYGSRTGVRLAEVTAQISTQYLTAALFQQDPVYRPLLHGSVPRRFGHAIAGAFIAHQRNGEAAFAPGTITGAVAASLTSAALLPRSTPRKEFVSRGISALGSTVTRSLWREFITKRRQP